MNLRRSLAGFALSVALILGAGLAVIPQTHAQVDAGLAEVGQTVKLGSGDPRVIASRIINVVLGLVGIVLVGLLVYAGFLYMTAAGDAEKTGRAKKIILSSIIGLIIVLSSWAIARFVIEKLLQATGGGGGGGGGGQQQGGGGLGGGGGSNVFQVKSISPQGKVLLRNVQVKMLFSRPVDEKSVSAIVITKTGGATVAGALSVNGSTVAFTPAAACPAPNQNLKCFDGDSDFTVQIGNLLRSTQGQAIVCGGFAPPCTAIFHTGNLIDVKDPSVTMLEPLDGQSVPSDSLVNLRATAQDDSGISYIEFFDNGQTVDKAVPNATATPLVLEGEVQWDTAGLPLQSERQIAAKAFDVDAHEKLSSPVGVVIRPLTCFNGVKDGEETGIDCGGTPNTPGFCGTCAGGQCNAHKDCATGVCLNGFCVEQPTITVLSPLDGKPGTFVTLQGVNFGAGGAVTFLGGPGAGDDILAQAPEICLKAGITAWTNTQVIVAVPQAAKNGPLQITNGQSQLSDATNDARGPKIPDFLVNDKIYPGLCSLIPAQGFVGEQFKAVGQGFGNKPSSLTFGVSILNSFAAWTDALISANVPVVGSGKHAVKVKVGSDASNPAYYTVQSKIQSGPPQIFSLDPGKGPKEEYVTLFGKNFGYSIGKVIFRNKLTGDEALGDTSFPAACANGFWSETNVIVKVPTQFLNKQSLAAPGDYGVKLIRSDNAMSNAVDFTATAGNAKPGICSIVPNVGPVNTPVAVTGERFGANTGSLTFQVGVNAVSDSWVNSEIKGKVPSGAVTGPVTAAAQGLKSNAVNYQVKNCNEQPGICSQNQQCCANGTCIPENQVCGAVAQNAMYAWQSSTGLIPVAPQVVEECLPNEPQPPIPSPAPWDKRAGGEQVCVGATVSLRFTTKLDPTSVTKANFKIKKCTSQAKEPCTTTENVALKAGSPLLQPASQTQDAVFLNPGGDLSPNTTYLVEVMTGVKGFGAGGAYMDENPDCGKGAAYCFRFRTRDNTAQCAVGAVSVAPHPYELNDAGAKVNYLASPLSSDDKCVVLKCEKYDWSWFNGDPDNNVVDGRATFETPLKPGEQPGTFSCQQVGVAQSETGNVPVNMTATVKPDNVKGVGHLYVKFIPPVVEDYGPNCNVACVNALIWARFSAPLDLKSLAGNVEIRPCANENCVLSELGEFLPITADKIKALPVPKTSELEPRFLQIEPTNEQGSLLLVQSKYYRVLLKGGTETGLRGKNGVPMAGLNDPEGFVWTFRTRLGEEALCKAESIGLAPIEKYETVVDARQMFSATPYSPPDECSAMGQLLVQTNNMSWKSSEPKVAQFFPPSVIDTGGKLPAQCSASCLALGSQGVFGKVAVCGNGLIETTNAAYCQGGKTPFGDACAVLPAGAKDAEECDPGIPAHAGKCHAQACLWKPVAQLPQGTCGNVKIDFGEECDFGKLCVGADPESKIADYSSCNTDAQKGACEKAGGVCAPQPYRGCSAFCQHTGAKSGKSTCGNGDLADGEDCDDGNSSSQDGCSADCLHTGSRANVVSVCGNAILEAGETCEKNAPNEQFPPGCNAQTCLHTGTDLCDNDPNTPNVNCCGNGSVDQGEDCDEGNKEAGDGCSAICLLEGSSVAYLDPSFCSDGVLETGEQCEAGLASNNPKLLQGSKNAVPKYPPAIVGTGKGDGKTDSSQLAYIVGDAEPDDKGIMSSKITAAYEGKSGEATYGLQCGFTTESACAEGYGLTDKGCCQKRPKISTTYPLHGAKKVCRNAQISVNFETTMDSSSVANNAQIAKQLAGDKCPEGTKMVWEDFTPVKDGFAGWVQRAWRKLIAWVSGRPAWAAVWCSGSVSGTFAPEAPDKPTQFVFNLKTALESNTLYRVKFLGDNSKALDPLSDNDNLSKKFGIKTAKGVVAAFDPAPEQGPLTWSFTTGEQVCGVNFVQVSDTSKPHPLLFLKPDEKHAFQAKAISLHEGIAVPIVPLENEYAWKWEPWTTSDKEVVFAADPNPGDSKAEIVSQNKNGNAFVVAWLKVAKDIVNNPSTEGKVVQGTAPVTVLLCENPWPGLSGPGPIAPFRDKQPTGNGDDSSLKDTIFEKGPYFNFLTTYCRDAGVFGTEDDLPQLKINPIPPTSVDKTEGILRQYLFTYDILKPEEIGLKKDGVGIRIAANPLHLSPEDWYAWRRFGGSPQSILVDGYRALEDGTTTYVAAANTEDPGKSIYSNIYLISHNPDAAPVTVGIYDQMVKSLAFNINLTNEVSNVCMEGNDPTVYGGALFKDANGKTVACSTDFDCLKHGDNIHCGSFKLKLARDTVRLANYDALSRKIESYYEKTGSYPKLQAGTYLQSLSVSRWPSWTETMASQLGGEIPQDPVNQFVTCGRCTVTGGVCSSDADCPFDSKCEAQTLSGATFDPATCWDSIKRQYLCPRIVKSPSRFYQYRAIDGGKRYELASEFEIPKPVDDKVQWWIPELTKEVLRCVNAETLGFACTKDADCRPCPNPQDPIGCPENQFKTQLGACKPVGGRFLYQDVCSNFPYGQSGTCGDGVISPEEVCEMGETKIADCKTSPDLPANDGLKLQACSECKGFVDDLQQTKCEPGIKCGNGRVDKKCVGGTRNGLACLADKDCPAPPGAPPAYCGPTNEVCDDGPLNGSYGKCNISCTGYAGYCGDGQLSPGELCDHGESNGTYCKSNCAKSCSLDCKGQAPFCGDGLVTTPEECDGQTLTTTSAVCLKGKKDIPCATDANCGEGGECAKQGNLASCEGVKKNRCATSLKLCLSASGNVKGPGFNPADPNQVVCQEDADCNGNKVCRAIQDYVEDCTEDAQCSYPGIPGVCQPYPTAHLKVCSNSGANKCAYPLLQATNSIWSECKVLNSCGDGIIDKPAEECDDGSKNGDTKACTSTCRKNICGDGKVLLNIEDCDNGEQNGKITCNADYGSSCASCSSQCKFLAISGGYCGDKKKNGPEQCDGNADAVITKQKCNFSGASAFLCPFATGACLKEPCQKTTEDGVTCKSLGYDFSTNGTKPKLALLDPNNYELKAGSKACKDFLSLTEYEYLAYHECLGFDCKITGQGNQMKLEFLHNKPLPTVNEFWQCVKEKGPALGIGISSENTPELVQCAPSCVFAGCARCSDESGTGAISAQIVDAVYNQVVPFAKVSLFHKGVVVSQVATDEDGKFTFTSLNDRPECTQYKLVVDKYDDNPCTGKSAGKPNCGAPAAPPWNYSDNVKEDERGGYWPLTTKTFSVNTFGEEVAQNGRLLLFPRPGTGEAYVSVVWEVPFATGYVKVDKVDYPYVFGGHNLHLLLPDAYAYTMPKGTDLDALDYPKNFAPTTCSYADRPAENNQCVRDVSWRDGLKGHSDLTKFPFAQLTCLHSAGERTGGWADEAYNGCPIEGIEACLAQNPGKYAYCNVSEQEAGKKNLVCFEENPDDCKEVQEQKSPCWEPQWDICSNYNNGPLTLYVNYAAFAGSVEPLRFMYDDFDKSIYPAFNQDSENLASRLFQNKFSAYVSTEKELIRIEGNQVSGGNKDAKFWHIVDLDPNNAKVSIKNKLKDLRPEGAAVYQRAFSGAGAQIDDYHCKKGNTLYFVCSDPPTQTQKDKCSKVGGTCVKLSGKGDDYILWSRANY